jgi:HNH endonuclease
MIFNSSFKDRFWKKVHKTNTCWVWTASTVGHGYGQISWSSAGDMIKAHRASYILHFGPIPEDLCVCHKCDNPSCVNPTHLFLGTANDNIKDRQQKNRGAKKEQMGAAKLTQEKVIEIRKKYIPRVYSTTMLAKEYNVSQHTIFSIINNKTWRIAPKETSCPQEK